MGTEIYSMIFPIAILVIIITFGAVLEHHLLAEIRQRKREEFIMFRLTDTIQRVSLSTVEQLMDTVPDKLREIKKEIDNE